jgi:hypothetical protein
MTQPIRAVVSAAAQHECNMPARLHAQQAPWLYAFLVHAREPAVALVWQNSDIMRQEQAASLKGGTSPLPASNAALQLPEPLWGMATTAHSGDSKKLLPAPAVEPPPPPSPAIHRLDPPHPPGWWHLY